MKQNKLTVIEKNHLRMILNSSFYNFLDLKECQMIITFLTSFLENKQINYYQKIQINDLIEKLSIRNTLTKHDKRLLSLVLFIDKKKSKKRYENNINFIVSMVKNKAIQEKNNSKLALFKISLFIAFLMQLILIKGSAI